VSATGPKWEGDDKVSDSRQYFALDVVKQFGWEGGNSQQPVNALANQSELQQVEQTVRDSNKGGNSRLYFPLELVEQFDWDGGDSQQPVTALTDQLQQYNQTVSDTDQVCNSQQYFAHHAVERFDWDGGNYQQLPSNQLRQPQMNQGSSKWYKM
jgi:hypothetical protein